MTTVSETEPATRTGRGGRDRLRELLDAVLDDEHHDLGRMADGAHASRFHFARQVGAASGEAPVAMRRRVLMERAAWQLRQGGSVTEAAWDAGYESVEGFSRAYARAHGMPPSRGAAAGHWLPAPNGIHFHPPSSLWVEASPGGPRATEVLGRQVLHDVEDTAALLHRCADVGDADVRRTLLPGHRVLEWAGPEESLLEVLRALVSTREAWLAAFEGSDHPTPLPGTVAGLAVRHEDAAGRWLALVRDVERRDAWDDRLVDALCDPPESFVVGSVVHHVLTYSAHRRLLVRAMLRMLGHEVDDGDPITWQHERGEELR